MADQSRKTSDLPLKISPNSINDSIVFVYNPNTTFAQTALISISNLFANTANLKIVTANLQLNISNTVPANSTSVTITQGTLFFTNNNGYFAVANNHLKRFDLTDF